MAELVTVRFVPADPLVPVLKVPGRSAEAKQGDDTQWRMDEVTELSTHPLVMAQIMVAINQLPPEILVGLSDYTLKA